MKARLTAIVTATVFGASAIPVAVSAHTMPPITATTTAKQAVAKIKRETHAASGRVVTCGRQSQHRFLCKGEERYKAGARRCTFDIAVRYTSASARTAKYGISNYRCF